MSQSKDSGNVPQLYAENAAYLPLFDAPLAEHGATTAAVFGWVWRECQRSGQFCKPLVVVAKALCLSRPTVKRALDALCASGYLREAGTWGSTRCYQHTAKCYGHRGTA